MPSDWTKARDEAKAQAVGALFSALLGWFRRKLARKAPAPAFRVRTASSIEDLERNPIYDSDKAPRG